MTKKSKAWGKGTGEALILDWPGFLKYLKKYRSKRYP